MKKLTLILALFCFNINSNQNIKTTYNFTTDPIDVVMPCHEKDKRTLDLAIQGIKENGVNIRRIIVISEKKLTNLAEWAPENIFPFTKNDIVLAIAQGDETVKQKILSSGRIGWIYQQFLKLYAPFIIKDISPNVLLLDSDAIFLSKVEFMDKNGNPYFNTGTEEHKPYFEHAAKLLDAPFTIKKLYPKYSGICHHMLLQKPVLEDLFEKIEKKSGKNALEAICSYVNINEIKGSVMSEYEIYFNFIFSRTDQAKIRPLKYKDMAYEQGVKDKYKKLGYDYIACHTWIG